MVCRVGLGECRHLVIESHDVQNINPGAIVFDPCYLHNRKLWLRSLGQSDNHNVSDPECFSLRRRSRIREECVEDGFIRRFIIVEPAFISHDKNGVLTKEGIGWGSQTWSIQEFRCS